MMERFRTIYDAINEVRGVCKFCNTVHQATGKPFVMIAAMTCIIGCGVGFRRENPMENKPEPRVCGTCRNYDALLDAFRKGGSVRENRGGCGKWEKEK